MSMPNEQSGGANGTGRRGAALRVEQAGDEVVIRVPTAGSVLRTFLPDEAVTHMQRAQKEGLLALRSLIDAAVRAIDEKQGQGAAGQQMPRRVDIQVE